MFLRAMVLGVAIASAAGAGPAWADPKAEGDRLADEGKTLGNAGDFTTAIVRFKSAYAVDPQPKHICNIGLAYSQLHRLPQAQLFLARCQHSWTATADGPVPAFVAPLLAKIEGELRSGAFARVELTCKPDDARVVVSAFEPDVEVREAVFWLPVGSHQLTVSKPGFETKRVELEVDGNRQTVPLQVELVRQPAPAPAPTPALLPQPGEPVGEVGREDRSRRPSSLRWVVLGTGAAAVVGGAGLHLLALQARDEAEDLTVEEGFADKDQTYRRLRIAALGAYAVGAVGLAWGTYLVVRARSSERAPSVSLTPTQGGGMVWIGWQQ